MNSHPTNLLISQQTETRDRYNRSLHDLRISVIDRCNFRCTYCMPEAAYPHHHTFLSPKDWLTFEEIAYLAKIFVRLGVEKIRITGGEPLLRPNVDQLIRQVHQISGLKDLALTTNAVYLSKQAAALKESGLKRITVSLDTLDQKIFHQMNGSKGSVTEVLEGIRAAQQQQFETIKVNVVVQKGINDHNLLDLLRYFRGTGIIVRFIEYMDVGTCNNWQSDLVVSSKDILQNIQKEFALKPLAPNYRGEVAERYAYSDGAGEIGFISSVTQPFCGSCTRARLSPDGVLYTCLFAGEGTDLRTPLREGASEEDLTHLIEKVWQNRADRYSEERPFLSSLSPKRPKIEMYQIGG